jgi:hypothetical protein
VARSTSPRGYTVEYETLTESEGSDRLLREVVPARVIRPRPPRRCISTEDRVEHAPVDAFLNDAWWLGVDLGDADESGKVRVCFPDTREVMEFDAADVRPHLVWVRGYWQHFLAFHIVRIRSFSVLPGDFIVTIRNGDPIYCRVET